MIVDKDLHYDRCILCHSHRQHVMIDGGYQPDAEDHHNRQNQLLCTRGAVE